MKLTWTRSVIGAVVLSAISIGVAAPSIAAGSTNSGTAAVSEGKATKPSQHHVKYTDEEILALLLFGSGKAAEDHPDLAKKIKEQRPKGSPQATPEQIAQLAQKLREIDPGFHDAVTVAVQVNDPYQAQSGMKRLNEDLKKYMAQAKVPQTGDKVTPYGAVWHDANILTEINALAFINGAVYANVAGATEAVVALVVVPSAVSYGFEMDSSNALDADNMVAAVAEAL